MTLRLVMLEQARSSMAFGVDQFVEEYPGMFLLAIGLVASEPAVPSPAVARLRRKETQELQALDIENTFSMGQGERLTHSLNDHPLAGCTFFLPRIIETPLIVGRRPECDLTVPDISVSDEHCRLKLVNGIEMMATDLGSTNGTLVNLLRLEQGVPTPIEDEAILTVGRYSFQYFTSRSLYHALHILEQSR